MLDFLSFFFGGLFDRFRYVLCATVELTPGGCTGLAGVKGGRCLGAEHNAFFRQEFRSTWE